MLTVFIVVNKSLQGFLLGSRITAFLIKTAGLAWLAEEFNIASAIMFLVYLPTDFFR